ncbi:MAG: hypothetical protein ACRDYA_22585 [Egibacteraceae bacterium]
MNVVLAVGTARRATELLQLLAELPSTPPMVAAGAQQHIAAVEEHLPTPHRSQLWDSEHPRTDTVCIEPDSAEAIAELLELFAAMPSTPPAMAAEARHQAAAIWSVLPG